MGEGVSSDFGAYCVYPMVERLITLLCFWVCLHSEVEAPQLAGLDTYQGML